MIKMVKIVMSRLGLSLLCCVGVPKVVLKGPIYRRFSGEIGWLCMLLGFGFQENNSFAPQ